MITYLYWAIVIVLAGAIVGLVGIKAGKPGWGFSIAALVLLVAWSAYYFHFQQIFVKRWGGVMSISVPQGQHHMGATWKDEHLWIQNFDPATNTCIFSEYSKGNVLEGRVKIKNCNPVIP